MESSFGKCGRFEELGVFGSCAPDYLPRPSNWQIISKIEFSTVATTLHTVAAPAVRAAVKTELSCRKDTIIVLFFAANKNKDNVQVAIASSNT